MYISLLNILARVGFLLCLSFFCISIAFAQQAQQIGQVRLVIGSVLLDSSVSGSRQLELGDQIFQGDQITTPATGYVVITLIDDTKFTIKPGSVFKFNDVINQANGKVFTELLKGGLKAISGTIGRQNPAGFKVDTPLGSIGIRGTNFDAILCESKSDNCIKLHEALGCPQVPPGQTEDLLYVTVTQGTAYLDDCQDDPDIIPGQVGITDGTASGCDVLDEVPCFMQEFNQQQEQQKDQTLKSLEVPALQVHDINAFCQGDPICIQCEGNSSCIQCDGDPDCIQCQGDPICLQCLGDSLCVQCQGDPLCIQCDADPQCIQCQADQVCILCMGDPVCEVCQGDQVCIDRLNNPMQPGSTGPGAVEPDPMEPVCDPGDIGCICMINPEDPICPTQCPPNDIVCECGGDLDCICSMDPGNPICPTLCPPNDIVCECGGDLDCICSMDPGNPMCPTLCPPNDIVCECGGDLDCICSMDPGNPMCPTQCQPNDIVCECGGDLDCICSMDPGNPMCPTQCPPNDIVCECEGDLDCICSMDPDNPMCPMQCSPNDVVCECEGDLNCICSMDPNNPMCPMQCPPDDAVCECDGNLDCICSMDPDNAMCDPGCSPDDSVCLCMMDDMCDANCGPEPNDFCICEWLPDACML